jgi:hypothetical protein
LGPKIFFSVELLRPLVSVSNDFLKFLIFEVLKKLLKNFTSLRVCSSLYAYAEHTHQELMRKLSIRARHWAHAEHTSQELMSMLSTRISS